MNINKLCGRIIEKFGSQHAFAQAMNMTDSSLSGRLNGRIDITVNEISRWIQEDALDIPPEEIKDYFF